jgi:hypothetical protein
MNYELTKNEVYNAANALVDIARTPANANGFVSSDEVRAYLVRATKQHIEGTDVTHLLLSMFDRRSDNRYVIPN